MAFGLGAFVILICVIDASIWHRRAGSQTLAGFFLLDGRLRLPGFVGTIVAANLSLGNFIVFICTWGYTFGFAGIVFFLCNLFLNVLGFVLFLPAFRSYIEDRMNNGTIHDYLAHAYGGDPHSRPASRIRLSASIVTVVCLSLAMVFELSLAVQLLHPADLTQTITLFVCLAALIAFFTAYGGFRTLITSDVANATILAIGLICLIGLIVKFSIAAHTAPLAISLTMQDVRNLGWPNIVSILLIGSGWMLVAMDQWQRSCASRSYRVTFRGMFIYFFILALFAITFATWGAFDHTVLPTLLGKQAQASLAGATNPLMDIAALPVSVGVEQFVVMFIVSGLIFAAVSTTNTFLNVCSHSLTTDVLVGSFAHKEMGELTEKQNRTYIRIGRTVILGLAVLIAVVFAFFVQTGLLKDPLSFFFITYSVQFALLAPMAISVLPARLRPSAPVALTSICIGFVIALAVGFGAWMLMQDGSTPSLGLAPSDWETLTPVVTVIIGFLPLLFAVGRRLVASPVDN